MKKTARYLLTGVCLYFAICLQITSAQTHIKKPAGSLKASQPRENYITQEIKKKGTGDHGIYYDTLSNKIKPEDPLNAAGKQYQDIRVTLGAGDVINANVSSGFDHPLLSLLSNVNGQLKSIKAAIDTSSTYTMKLLYKATAAGTYTFRVTCKKKTPREKYDRQYFYENDASYNLKSIIATPESGVIMDNPAICDQVQFLIRQRVTDYLLITGQVADTTMDVLDKKKIGFINHLSSFTIDKNSKAKISIDPNSAYFAFDQSLFYNSDADAAKAQQYFIENFRTCLGPDWKGAVDSGDANWYKFEREGQKPVNIILYAGYKYVQILM
ncbi:hypothetical protein [uncultured Mucilaginibacter sp.]|uniref:hypothetical protein n=1 Tax=uncultured Mucilaginibacter sp. TaxID=797541 RepID=UPI0025E1AFD0|nr:hypothetical protein [uncultured Mucilaginibacter sp.]